MKLVQGRAKSSPSLDVHKSAFILLSLSLSGIKLTFLMGFLPSLSPLGYWAMLLKNLHILWYPEEVCDDIVSNSEKAMAPHSSTLAWKIPWTEEPGRLQSMGLLRVGHNWATSLSLFTFMHWRRKWQPTPVFLPRESQGQGSLAGCCLWGRTESDTTEVT